jgi:hypothetical protein
MCVFGFWGDVDKLINQVGVLYLVWPRNARLDACPAVDTRQDQ